MKVFKILGNLFNKKGGDIIEKGMDLTADNIKSKRTFKIILISVLGVLLLAGGLQSEDFMLLIKMLF